MFILFTNEAEYYEIFIEYLDFSLENYQYFAHKFYAGVADFY